MLKTEFNSHLQSERAAANDVAAVTSHGFQVFVRERWDRITGYLMPGIFGHGVAETDDDTVALIQVAGRLEQPDQLRLVFCRLREHRLYGNLLRLGVAVKVMNLMTVGPYEQPNELWIPSVPY